MKTISVILVFLFFFGNQIFAQTKSFKPDFMSKSYQTKKINENIIKVDGDFSDESWSKTEWGENFFQFSPKNGETPTQKTLFKILYDENNLYIAIEAQDNEPDKIDKRLIARDNIEGDIVGIQIDSYFDKQTAFVFAVNAAGVKIDGVISGDNDNNFDVTWNPVWLVKTKITDKGWNAEMKIPLSQIRFADKENQTWGFEIVRLIYRTDEYITWGLISKDGSGWVSKFNELKGISNIKPKKQAELSPYIMSAFESYKPETGNPFSDGKDVKFNAGLDGKIGVTNDFTLDFAVNPDFGQVEADPSEVNLTAYETYLSEKRSFFVEGSNITNFGITPGGTPWSRDLIFYSRRIGRAPQYSPYLANGEFMDMPRNTKILGALKLTGKSKNGLSVGIIETLANREFAEIDFEGDRRKVEVEPLTNYFITRVQKDFNKGNTILGGIVTSTYRDLNEPYLNNFIEHSETAGLDFSQYFKEKKYYIFVKLVGSKITGSKDALLDQQYSSRRYFQRPDADYLQIDSSMQTMIGHGGNIMFGKQAHKGFQFGFDIMWRSPKLELNDVGYMRQSDIIFQFLWLNYRITEPFSIFRSVSFDVNQWSGYDFGGTYLFKGGNVSAYSQFKNYWSIGIYSSVDSKNIDNSMLWGGPSMKIPASINYGLSISSNQTKKFVFEAGGSFNKVKESHANSENIYTGITYRPINSLSVSLSPLYSQNYSNLQYLDKVTVDDETRYILASMNQKTFALTVRINLSITPDFTIQYYGSPFISSGLFTNYKHITNPSAENYTDRFVNYSDNEIQFLSEYETFAVNEPGLPEYSIGLPDFNYKQLKSNLVLRWEFLPGSLLYLVWAQDRTDAVSDGNFDYFKNIEELFKIDSYDVFLLKLSYRISI